MLDQSPDAAAVLPDRYDGPILEIENLSISFFTRLREILR
ncbi:Oligopeptide/dipeptide ABC transporter, ATP-binding protein [Roseibacterium elongatum DSM 19469]|uniref:Oligopeptide/dipeptide ABC transporter, ATP-binding protein n=1 Tax=Roseicyclus elongatus DSM 19469 TaxID=1294273 RepID=W8S480_9RHOB|nr:Oligopeptide/dipeptide ABC transporter, ATP-binding protein [Roseibacterium elongatum DSM 19469]